MRKVIRTVMAAIGLSACLIVLAACSREGELSEASGGELMLRVGLSLSARSSELVGEEYENKIDIAKNDYRIYFFDTNDKFIAEFTPDDFTQASDKSHEYSVTGKAPAGLATYTDFKMVVLANWGETAYPTDLEKEKTTIEDICTDAQATFDFFSPEELIKGKKLIPFYGVRQYTGVEFKPNDYVDLKEPVELLRAMAKVEVLLNSEVSDLTIKEVKIHRYHSKGYCAPKGVYSEANDYEKLSLHLIENGKVEDTADFSKDNLNKWIIYLPEYNNQNANDNYSYITVKFAQQTFDEDPHSIYFAEYTEGKTENKKRMDIQRNHLYRFTVKATPLNFQVSVDKWEFGGKVHIEM